MKIDINKIDEGRFAVREENNINYIEQLTSSFKLDGQWNPIIVRPKLDGRYEVIAGHYRLKAAKKAGFKEIEVTVRDLPDDEADILSIKTNILRLNMTEREQGKVLSRLMNEHDWKQSEIARRLGVSDDWVRRRLRVALELHETVAQALEEGKIGFQVAAVISQIPPEEQVDFLDIIIKRGIKDHTDAGVLRRQFFNDTIFTIGYQGIDINKFITLLNYNKIDLLVDIRYSSESQYKPEFNGTILERELERHNIKYLHHSEFGLPYIIQNPYKDGLLNYNCIKQWYNWHINTNTNLEKFITILKSTGKSALMCMEQYAKPNKEQKIFCHRDLLADMILQHNSEDILLRFKKRIDL